MVGRFVTNYRLPTLQNGALTTASVPATFGRVKDANGNYLRNSTLRGAPFQAQFGLRVQF